MIKVQTNMERVQNNLIAAFYYFLKAGASIAVSFFISQCYIFENISPFSLILLSVSYNIGLIPTFCYLGSALGTLFSPFDLSTFKYITALTMVYVIYMVFRKSLRIIKNNTAIFTAACCFISGFLFLLVGQLTLYNVLFLIGESVLICCCIYFIDYAAMAFKKNCYLSAKDIIAFFVTLVLVLSTLHNVYFFNLSAARILGIGLIVLALYSLKTSHAVVFGCCMGIILSTISNGNEPIFSAIIIGTLGGCVFSSLSNRLGTISFILLYYSTLLFFGLFPWNYWYFSEPIIAVSLTMFVPKKKLYQLLASYIPVKQVKKQSESPNELLFDYCRRECSRVCMRSELCYAENEDALKTGIENIEDQYKQEKNTLNLEINFPFCIKKKTMARIIRKKLSSKNPDEIGEMIRQLEYLSRKIEHTVDLSIKSIRFLDNEEKIIKKGLEKSGLNVKDISFICDEHNCIQGMIQFEAAETLTVEKNIREAVLSVIKSPLTYRIERSDDDYIAKFKETTNYEIQCYALCKTKDGETFSGDHAIGFSVGKDKYYLLLADGMGSGKQAGSYSIMLTSTIKKLIQNGLNIQNTLNLMQSILRFNVNNLFSTLDLCEIDLTQGIASFYKSGAYDSYLFQEDQCILISGGGIPIGLSEDDHIKHQTLNYSDGDYLLMCSDGFAPPQTDLWQYFNSCKSDDLRIFIKNLLIKYSEENPSAGDDDITIMICKLNKRNK